MPPELGAQSTERRARSAGLTRPLMMVPLRLASRVLRSALRATRSALWPQQPWQRLAICVWATILVVVCVRGFLNTSRNSVYPIFATAARDCLAGADLYRSAEAPYRYSPLVATLLVPFSLWPDSIGGVLWRLLNAAAYLAGLGWWCRVVLPRALTTSQQALLYLLVIPLSVGSLNNGQSNALILGLLLAGVSAVARGGWRLASGCLALACLFKIYPIAVGLLVAAVYPRRFAAWFLIAVATGLALPFLWRPTAYVLDQYAGWWHLLLADDRQKAPVDLWYRDLRLVCQVWHVPLGASAYLMIQLLAAVAIGIACIAGRLAHWQQRRLLILLFSLACCWMALLGPATESSTYILLAPTLAWTILDAWLRPVPWWLRAGLVGCYGLFLVTQTAVWFPGAGRQVHTLGLQPLAGLLLAVCVVVMQLHESLSSTAAEAGCGAIRPAEAA